jgi:hypothetical protein
MELVCNSMHLLGYRVHLSCLVSDATRNALNTNLYSINGATFPYITLKFVSLGLHTKLIFKGSYASLTPLRPISKENKKKQDDKNNQSYVYFVYELHKDAVTNSAYTESGFKAVSQ